MMRICYEAKHYPPYILQSDSTPKGILIDIVTFASQKAEQPIALYSNSWERCQRDVKAGRAHALFAMVRTDKRQTEYAFPPENKLNTWHMWLAEYPVFTSINYEFDIDTYKPTKGIGAPLGYVVWSMLEQKNWLSPYQYEPVVGLQMLEFNKLDGYVVEKLIGLKIIQENKLTSKVIVSQQSFLDTRWYLPVNKDFYHKETALVHRFWETMAEGRKMLLQDVEVP